MANRKQQVNLSLVLGIEKTGEKREMGGGVREKWMQCGLLFRYSVCTEWLWTLVAYFHDGWYSQGQQVPILLVLCKLMKWQIVMSEKSVYLSLFCFPFFLFPPLRALCRRGCAFSPFQWIPFIKIPSQRCIKHNQMQSSLWLGISVHVCTKTNSTVSLVYVKNVYVKVNEKSVKLCLNIRQTHQCTQPLIAFSSYCSKLQLERLGYYCPITCLYPLSNSKRKIWSNITLREVYNA